MHFNHSFSSLTIFSSSKRIEILEFEDGRYEGELIDNKIRHGKGKSINNLKV